MVGEGQNERLSRGPVDLAPDCFQELEPPVLVFGGCYGNLEATQALFAAARRLEIPPRSMICTGDVVAYCADPRATIDLVRDAGVRVIMENCEESLAMGASDCGCGFAEGTACERLASGWYEYADANVDAETLAWTAATCCGSSNSNSGDIE